MADGDGELLGEGRFLRLLRQGRWEHVERMRASGVVTIVAITPDRRLILTEQFRPPVGRACIELPAGLAGDVAGQESEDLIAAARRELLEETGYTAERFERLAVGPSSAGLTNELITFYLARGLTKVGGGGGDGSEEIVVHEPPLSDLASWLARQVEAGKLVDYKIAAGLWMAAAAGA
jgi:ADP-ribose pyrophosphatase